MPLLISIRLCPLTQSPHKRKDPDLLDHLARWLRDDAYDKKREVLDTVNWKQRDAPAPKQANGYDCGIFIMMWVIHDVGSCVCCWTSFHVVGDGRGITSI